MFKPSRRAAVIAASFALGLSAVGPAAHAGLLGGSDSNSTAIEGVGLPVAGDLLGGDLLGGLLGGGLPLVGDVLGGELLGGELLNVVTDTTLHCDAAIPQVLRTFLGETTDAVCEPFSNGLLGLLGSL